MSKKGLGKDSSASPRTDPYPWELIAFVARFDRREYWLAHEELEELWHRDRSDFYKGLIQIAAAFVHIDRGNWNGARRLLRTAGEYLEGYPARHSGFDLAGIRGRVAGVRDRVDALVAGDAEGFDEGLRWRMSELFEREVDADAVEEVELPYRVRRYERGYRPWRKEPG